MSYDIDQWVTKKLDDFCLPIKAFYEHERDDWHPKQAEILDVNTMEIKLSHDDLAIWGILKEGIFTIKKFEMYGEGSGTFKSWILDKAFEQSTGELEAILVYEEGDAITRFTVKDGNVKETKINLTDL